MGDRMSQVDPFMSPRERGYTDLHVPEGRGTPGSAGLTSTQPRGSGAIISPRSDAGYTQTTGTSGSGTPWYLRTAFIVAFIVILLLALALGVGLGVGLTERDNNSAANTSSISAGDGAAGDTTVAGSTTWVTARPVTQTQDGSTTFVLSTVTASGSVATLTQPTDGTTLYVTATISETQQPVTITRTELQTVVTGTSTTTLGGGSTRTITQASTRTVLQTVTITAGGGGARRRRRRELKELD